MKQDWRYGAASAASELIGGLRSVTLRGPITLQVLSQLKLDLALQNTATTHAIVADWRRAVCAVSVEDLGAVALDGEARGPSFLAGAIVANEESLATFHDHAWRMFPHGILRVTFLRLDDAVVWAQAQVRASLARREQLPPALLAA